MVVTYISVIPNSSRDRTLTTSILQFILADILVITLKAFNVWSSILDMLHSYPKDVFEIACHIALIILKSKMLKTIPFVKNQPAFL